ncbi:right-handed parallel beta-helix repeat-containing protein [Streptosporangium sp. NPDC051022]|uniref:right-handed parallel beta-helix repeat-containing protein n=1 Tax=Streptosporangium sp. NPDC051022 TaxID=3155752 RepID=UPI0034424221
MGNERKTARLLRGAGLPLTCALLVTLAGTTPARASAAAVNCGDTLSAGTTLTADLTCADGGLRIDTDGVTLDLGGHTFTGTGLTVEATGVTVKNGKIVGTAETGLSVYRPGSDVRAGATLSDVQVLGKDQTSGKTLVRNATLAMSGTPNTCVAEGLSLVAATATIEQCTVRRDVNIQDSTGWTVVSSTLTNGRLTTERSTGGTYNGTIFDNFPVTIGADSGSDLFQDNLFRNSETAFEIKNGGPLTQRTTIDGNVFMNNSIGLLGSNGFDVPIVRNNVFHGNRTVGLLINQSSMGVNPNPIADNIFFGNGASPRKLTDLGGNTVRGGLHVFIGTAPQPDLTLARNTGLANGGFLIWAKPGSVTDGGGNRGPCGPRPNPSLTCA